MYIFVVSHADESIILRVNCSDLKKILIKKTTLLTNKSNEYSHKFIEHMLRKKYIHTYHFRGEPKNYQNF